jgi:hypothetical protein
MVVIEFTHGWSVHELFIEGIRAAMMFIYFVSVVELDVKGMAVVADGGDGAGIDLN